MENPIYRTTRPGDEKQLKKIWERVYVEDINSINAYFDLCYKPSLAVTAEINDSLCSSMYLIEGFVLQGFEEYEANITYLYALGTLPEYRHNGIGGHTVWYSGIEASLKGAEFVCLVPASQRLANWYRDILGTRSVFFYRSGIVTTEDSVFEGELKEISSEEYAVMREKLLQGLPHVKFPLNVLRYQERCCKIWMGGFYKIITDNKTAICAMDIENSHLTIRELLAPDCDPTICTQIALDKFHCISAETRTPVFWNYNFGEIVEQCVIIPNGSRFPKSDKLPYWGLAMD